MGSHIDVLRWGLLNRKVVLRTDRFDAGQPASRHVVNHPNDPDGWQRVADNEFPQRRRASSPPATPITSRSVSDHDVLAPPCKRQHLAQCETGPPHQLLQRARFPRKPTSDSQSPVWMSGNRHQPFRLPTGWRPEPRDRQSAVCLASLASHDRPGRYRQSSCPLVLPGCPFLCRNAIRSPLAAPQLYQKVQPVSRFCRQGPFRKLESSRPVRQGHPV